MQPFNRFASHPVTSSVGTCTYIRKIVLRLRRSPRIRERERRREKGYDLRAPRHVTTQSLPLSLSSPAAHFGLISRMIYIPNQLGRRRLTGNMPEFEYIGVVCSSRSRKAKYGLKHSITKLSKVNMFSVLEQN